MKTRKALKNKEKAGTRILYGSPLFLGFGLGGEI